MTDQLIYWLWQSNSGKLYSCACRDGRQVTIARTPAIAALDDVLGALKQQRRAVQTEFDDRFSGAATIDEINAAVALMPSLDAAIVVAENNLWAELTKEN